MEIFSGIIGTISIILLIFIIRVIYKIPTMINDKLKDARSLQNSHDLQVESYFRQVGNIEIKSLLDDWISLIVDMNQKRDPKFIQSLNQRTILLGSAETVKIMADMMQFNYNNQTIDPEGDNSFVSLVYIAMIIASLKQDFTGYKVSPLDIIRVKINDFEKYKDKYKQIYIKLKE